MNTFVNNKKVVLSGSLVSCEDEEIRFELAADFVVVFRFASDPSTQDIRRDAQIQNGQLIFTFVNCENSGGIANRGSITLGRCNGHAIALNYALYYIGTREYHSRVIAYTFFEG